MYYSTFIKSKIKVYLINYYADGYTVALMKDVVSGVNDDCFQRVMETLESSDLQLLNREVSRLTRIAQRLKHRVMSSALL